MVIKWTFSIYDFKVRKLIKTLFYIHNEYIHVILLVNLSVERCLQLWNLYFYELH